MSLAEIQKAIEALAPEEQEELRNWLDGYDPAMNREWAGIAQERMRQIKSGEVAPLDGVRAHYSPHSFSATGITNFLENDGTLEAAQRIAGHADSRTTKLYDRRGQKVLLEDMERIRSSVQNDESAGSHIFRFSEKHCFCVLNFSSEVTSFMFLVRYNYQDQQVSFDVALSSC
jgi:hypothetical protein